MKYLALTLCLLSSAAQAFTLNSPSDSNLKGWENPEVRFLINTANCPATVDVVAAFNAAASIWNGIPTSRLKIVYGGTTTSTDLSSPPTVYCEPNFETRTGLDEDFTVGAGAIQTANSRISTGLLVLNVSTGFGNIGTADPETLKIIMAHEIGHVIGLGHADESSALMYFDASLKQTAKLSQDDIDGITYLYPRDEWGGDPVMGCGLVRDSHPPSSWMALLPFVIFAVWMFLRRPKAEQFFVPA